MSKLYQDLDKLLDRTLERICEEKQYLKFLHTAAFTYKYSFYNQLLIYIQKPSATAVADIEIWNKIGRYVNGGSTSIKIIENDKYTKHVFDIADTNSRTNQNLNLWKFDNIFFPQMFKELNLTSIDSEKNSDFLNMTILTSVLHESVGTKYASDFGGYNNIVEKSLLATVCCRCGIPLDETVTFKEVENMSANEMKVVGSYIACVSRDILKEFEKISKRQEKLLTTHGELSETIGNEIEIKNNKEEFNNEQRNKNRVRTSGGLQSTDDKQQYGAGEPRTRQVGEYEAEVSEKEQHPALRDYVYGQDLVPTPTGDRPNRQQEGELAEEANVAGERSDRGIESERPIRMDTPDLEYSTEYKRNDTNGTDLQLSFLSQDEQIAIIETAEEKPSAVFYDENIVTDVLTNCGNVVEYKYRIYNFYKNNAPTMQDAALFLKNEYGWGGQTYIFGDNNKGWINYNTGGIEVKCDKGTLSMTWEETAKKIGSLISNNKYLNTAETTELNTYNDNQEKRNEREKIAHDAQSLFNEYQKNLPLTIYTLSDCLNCYVNEKEKTYTLHSEGDKVSIMLFKALLHIEDKGTPEQKIKAQDFIEKMNLFALEENKLPPPDKVITFFRIGSFYEVYGEGAVTLSNAGDLSLIDKEVYGVICDCVGFPDTYAEKYRNLLSTLGYTVDIVDDDVPFPIEKNENSIEPTTENAVSTEIEYTSFINHHFEKNDIAESFVLQKKISDNICAITLLKKLENENRLANRDEQAVLAKYVGWGGLSQAFKEGDTFYRELKSTLTEREYADAMESTLSAFYTHPDIISSVYTALGNFGFKNGKILEPACGIGNFFGALPNELQSSKLVGIEQDSISGLIAKQLYQTAKIEINGFEKTNFKSDSFDVVVGNVPFGQFKVNDTKFNKYNFLIHDYFFAKSLDLVRPGGFVALITSKGTLDKENPALRKYLSTRAELIGAIRLPNTAFKSAGTQVTSDILFLQKKERMTVLDNNTEWLHLNKNENGIVMNEYFVTHPNMICGNMAEVSGQYGPETACLPVGKNLIKQLNAAIKSLTADYVPLQEDLQSQLEKAVNDIIPANPNVRDFSYVMENNKIYYRENDEMQLVKANATAMQRIRSYIVLRDCTRNVIDYQIDGFGDEEINQAQKELMQAYIDFTDKNGLITSRANQIACSNDASYNLVYTLERLDEDGKLLGLADLFTKRTIKPHTVVTSVDTPNDALALSISEKAKVDITYMQSLLQNKYTPDEIIESLKGVIYKDPLSDDSKLVGWQTADEYLSGNIREKLSVATLKAQTNESFNINVNALTKVMPIDLTASEISVRLGAVWLPPEDIENFIVDLLKPSAYNAEKIKVHYSSVTSAWWVENKNIDNYNMLAINTYGTSRINGYKIIEETLNLKDVRIYDKKYDVAGKETRELNVKETAIAQGKQEIIKNNFTEWIWADVDRRNRLCELYNKKYNAIRPREYDGSHIVFDGMNPLITLQPHQVNAVARVLYGGNSLLAHVVGAGKTYEMVAAAQESKRLGLCQKSLFVVPNHLTEQIASDYLTLYPAANILVATKADFTPNERKRFCGRIATGDYDAIIIGHSQFEKIPLSLERQERLLHEQIDEISFGIEDLKKSGGENYSIKQLAKLQKTLKTKLERLNNQERKDNLITFEQLGVDKIFIDEAHNFKNLFLYTKMRNVAGISQTEAQKSTDLFLKCRYLDEITGGKGIVFATGTPISNSMTELYTMQRYLQYNELERQGLLHFDSWASTFGETVTAIELTPEGTGYRAKTRFARFYNVPELISMFKETADVQTADMLDLKVPIATKEVIVCKPSQIQMDVVKSLADRAENVRNRQVLPTIDNMLKITNDGRKLALDSRLINPLFPADENGKVAICANKVYEIWDETSEDKLSQLVFCDLSTPTKGDSFSVYNDLKAKLLNKGIPENEIAFIHDADTEAKKVLLFGKVRSGAVRVLIGSTAKMGAGTNIQDKLIALHHLDCPWRPSDLEQREGRIIRKGNNNSNVNIYTYITENTFDAYLYQIVENKQKFIAQIMTSKSPVRSAEDIDDTALSYAEIKALATGNPYIKEKMDLDISVSKLKVLKSSYLSQKYAMEDAIAKDLPAKIKTTSQMILQMQQDIEYLGEHTSTTTENANNEKPFSPMRIGNTTYIEKANAATALLDAIKNAHYSKDGSLSEEIGEYRGFNLSLVYSPFQRTILIIAKNSLSYKLEPGADALGNITRLNNTLDGIVNLKDNTELELENIKQQLKNAETAVNKPFLYDDELNSKLERLETLNCLLDRDAYDENQNANETTADELDYSDENDEEMEL